MSIVIQDINDNNCIIETAVCDNPKRSILRNALCHSSTYACEYCEGCAQSYVCDKLKKNVNEEITHIIQQIHDLEEQQSTKSITMIMSIK